MPTILKTGIQDMVRLFLFLIFLLIPTALCAQNQINITVSATVQSSIELITIESMDLRNSDREDMTVRVDPLQSSSAGKMEARGTPGSEFRLVYLPQRELINTRGSGTLLFTYNIAGNHHDEQETAELLDQEGRDLEFNDDGEFYIWVGGHVNLSEAEPGSYEGEFTIEIEYI